jgi:hypothetical protein
VTQAISFADYAAHPWNVNNIPVQGGEYASCLAMLKKPPRRQEPQPPQPPPQPPAGAAAAAGGSSAAAATAAAVLASALGGPSTGKAAAPAAAVPAAAPAGGAATAVPAVTAAAAAAAAPEAPLVGVNSACQQHPLLVPRVSVGSMFSSSCWGVSDHLLYGVHYLHVGEARRWYCVPAEDGRLYEVCAVLICCVSDMRGPCTLTARSCRLCCVIPCMCVEARGRVEYVYQCTRNSHFDTLVLCCYPVLWPCLADLGSLLTCCAVPCCAPCRMPCELCCQVRLKLSLSCWTSWGPWCHHRHSSGTGSRCTGSHR